jgi:hypothetical protein
MKDKQLLIAPNHGLQRMCPLHVLLVVTGVTPRRNRRHMVCMALRDAPSTLSAWLQGMPLARSQVCFLWCMGEGSHPIGRVSLPLFKDMYKYNKDYTQFSFSLY